MADDRPVIMPGGVLPDPEFRIERREEPAHAELLRRLGEAAKMTQGLPRLPLLLREALAAIAQMEKELHDGHQRLNECSGWEATKDLPLYKRISKKIEQLVYEKQEIDHIRQAVGAEIDVLQGRAEAAEHRRAAAEYRAQRIVLDKELVERAEQAEAQLREAQSQIVELDRRARFRDAR